MEIAEERREVKDNRERKSYIELNVEFQGIARRDKKIFLNEQCKKKEEHNRMERLETSSRNWRY